MIYNFTIVKTLGCVKTSAMVNAIPMDQEARTQEIINPSLHGMDRMVQISQIEKTAMLNNTWGLEKGAMDMYVGEKINAKKQCS